MKGHLYAVVYDIPSDGRRTKISNVLKAYGERVQLSVFECWLTQDEYHRLMSRLRRLIDAEQDSVRLFKVAGAVQKLGVMTLEEQEQDVYVV